jgi:adenosylcobinamide-GDP ribazoletransferase
LRTAVGFLTILPVTPAPPPSTSETSAADGEAAAFLAPATALFPLIGALIGGLGALSLLASYHLGLHPLTCAFVALGVMALVTGALHEDGVADFVDGLSGGRTREERLSIMRDGRIGAHGTLALILCTALRATLLSGLFTPESAAIALVAATTLSRAALPVAMRWLPPARSDGLAAAAGKPDYLHISIAVGSALAITGLAAGIWALLVAVAGLTLVVVAIGLLADHRLGGVTGDVLGAMQVFSEIIILAAITALE